MTANPLNSGPRDSRGEEGDAVWALLARSPRPEPDVWFTVRALARCRLAETNVPQAGLFARGWRWALGAGLGLCLAMFLVVQTHHHHGASARVAKQKGVQEAFEIIASIRPDTDSSSFPSSDSSSWQDTSL